MSDLHVELLEAQVSWGQEAKAAVQPVQNCANDLAEATFRHLGRLKPGGELSQEKAEKLDLVIYEINSNNPKDDAFSCKLTDAVETAERFLEKHLKL